MTLPREVIPGRFYMVTRRCTQRLFLLRPDAETNNAFLYCLAEAAHRFGIDVILPCAMSNHHHTVIYDPHGTLPAFTEHFHKLLAKCQNALRGRWENLWSSEQVCVVRLVDPADVMRKLVYAATNPVKDRLVERVHHWPGVNGLAALLAQRPLHATRPRHFFRRDGAMPAAVTLQLVLPPELGDPAQFRDELRHQVAAVEPPRLPTGGTPALGSSDAEPSSANPGATPPRVASPGAPCARRLRPAASGRASRHSCAIASSSPPIAKPVAAGSPARRVRSPSAPTGSVGSRTFHWQPDTLC